MKRNYESRRSKVAREVRKSILTQMLTNPVIPVARSAKSDVSLLEMRVSPVLTAWVALCSPGTPTPCALWRVLAERGFFPRLKPSALSCVWGLNDTPGVDMSTGSSVSTAVGMALAGKDSIRTSTHSWVTARLKGARSVPCCRQPPAVTSRIVVFTLRNGSLDPDQYTTIVSSGVQIPRSLLM